MAQIGELVLPALPPGFLGVDPRTGLPTADDARTRAFLLSQAPSATPEQAEFFCDFAEATAIGKRRKWIGYGIGAACGLAVGVIACKVL